ncbi:gfo/Idh/MocA family oxidoreductase [Agrobacterium tumefaciens]|uniref:Gfo/Idh/MocA family protein n=1 Tax=Agrobacterium tumefaciens TaxID=358 RepID=UPI0012B8E2DA|nr:Gfo/Idh/MocA family oxidoreductase [Agrobacterium tumefaciens]MQB08043.1 gfo/Idh/MocA family oxidoreductase [Agrobacterium tumefaciens]
MTTPKKVRIVIVGAGQLANAVHYPSLKSFDDVDIVGVIELDVYRLRETCERFEIPESARFPAQGPNEYREIIKRINPDGVYVIGPTEFVYPIWVWCLQNGYPLYVEKPMAITMHQARVLAALAEENKLITQVSHQRRSAPIMNHVRNALLERGPIVHGVVEFFKSEPVPACGSLDRMLNDGTHAVDTARWLCGGEVVRVDSSMKRVGTPDLNWIGATLTFDNGATCYVVLSWNSGRRVFRCQMHVPGAYADVELESEARLYFDNDYNGNLIRSQDIAGSQENFIFGGFQTKSREFIDSLKHGADVCSSPFRDTVKTMEVCHTILAQAQLAGAA